MDYFIEKKMYLFLIETTFETIEDALLGKVKKEKLAIIVLTVEIQQQGMTRCGTVCII